MKIRLLCLVLLLLVSRTSAWSQIETIVGDLKYSISSGVATVTGLATDATDIVIPATIEYNGIDIPVKKIGGGAFKNTSLNKIQFPKGLTTIGVSAFTDCKNLSEINFPETIQSIREWAFKGCSKIKHLRITNLRYVSIGMEAFSSCIGLSSIEFKNNSIAYSSAPSSNWFSAFDNCSNLKIVYWDKFDESFTNEFKNTSLFKNCTSLHTIIIGNSGTVSFKVPDDMFENCPLLVNIVVLEGSCRIIKNGTTKYDVKDCILSNLQDSIYIGQSQIVDVESKLPRQFSVLVPNYSTQVNAGTYSDSIPIILGIEEEQYEFMVPFSYTIYPAPLTATIQNATREYGEENPKFNVTFTGFVNNETEDVLSSKGTVVTTATTKSEVGSYPITLSDAIARNYTITAEPATLTITKASLTAKATDVTRTYGQNNPQFSFTFSGLKNGETSPQWTTAPTFTTTANAESPVGLYPIEVSGGEAKNYEFTSSNGTLTVNKAELTIAADNKSRPYFEENPTLTCKYTGFVNGENSSVLTTQPTLKTNAEQASNAGNYPITVSGAEAQNYSIVYKQGNMEVTKRQLTVSTNNYSREYKEENPTFELRYQGFVNNEDESVLINQPKATTTATVNSDAGVYPITISGGVAANYDFLYAKSNLTIEKTYQTLSWTQEFEELEVYSQTELKAKTTSELDVTYTIVSGEGASISKIGKKTFLECTKAGTIVICAQQTGNNNYYESNKVYKTIRVGKANPSDVNGDNVIDSADIVAVIKEMPDGDMKADVNGDGVIDSADIVAVIKAMK